jgi:multisubunit Na+/H+ antiporter MnhG subunit
VDWSVILFVIAGALLVWMAIRIIVQNPQVFNRENAGKSIYTLGLLTLLIIGVVALCVLILKK